jgi:glycosyltransferase involved in cell wall biosynthesis
VCVIGHMREVKDPFRAAEATRLLPKESQIRLLHIGGALSRGEKRRAEREVRENARYNWVDEKPRWQAMRLLAQTRLLVLTSTMEGGANVVSEALACNVPVISTHISGSVGLLGPDYPGYFPVGDTQALTDLLLRAEQDTKFYASLKSAIRSQRKIVHPRQETTSWRALLKELK